MPSVDFAVAEDFIAAFDAEVGGIEVFEQGCGVAVDGEEFVGNVGIALGRCLDGDPSRPCAIGSGDGDDFASGEFYGLAIDDLEVGVSDKCLAHSVSSSGLM